MVKRLRTYVLQLHDPTPERSYMMEKLFLKDRPWERDENGILRQVKVPKAKQLICFLTAEDADYLPGSFRQPGSTYDRRRDHRRGFDIHKSVTVKKDVPIDQRTAWQCRTEYEHANRYPMSSPVDSSSVSVLPVRWQ